jgi:hypothetical protein
MQTDIQQHGRYAIFAATFLMLAGAGYLVGASMRAPLQSANGSAQNATHKLALRQESKAMEDSKVSDEPFRYGPEVNHGRSDTPVYASQQALRQWRADAAPGRTTARKSYRSRIAGRTGSETSGQ